MESGTAWSIIPPRVSVESEMELDNKVKSRDRYDLELLFHKSPSHLTVVGVVFD